MAIRDFKDDPYLSLLRPLVEAYLAFYRVGNRHIQSLGLTPGQFDVIAELEGTEGLTCAQLSEHALTTKGTLTGVLDRLEHRGLIERGQVGGDRRATRVQLTSKGMDLFQQVFPVHAEFMRPFFAQALNASEVQVAKRLLRRVRDSFEYSQRPPATVLTRADQKSRRMGSSNLLKKHDRRLATVRITKRQGQKSVKGE
jgi:DNA-binding MarR family transcriptional regulator